MTSLSTFARRAISHNKKTSLAVAASARRTFAGTPEDSANLVKTALNELHKELGGDMVPFAGYELPVLYKGENGGVMKEHLWCRSEGKASLFDVSHMGQVRDVLIGSSDNVMIEVDANILQPILVDFTHFSLSLLTKINCIVIAFF